MNLPQDIANQALDAIGWPNSIGDLEDGTFEARVLLRAYSQCLRQLLRAAHWNFARKQTPLVLLADATGQTSNVGVMVPQPWVYSYAYPNDCMKMRFVPWSWPPAGAAGAPTGNITPPNPSAPLMTGVGAAPWQGARLKPARWLEGIDYSNPPPAGVEYWTQQGVSPQGRTAVFTNVKYAQGVYTALMNYPSNWDPLFRAAFVAYLASEIALPIWTNKDRKFGMAARTQQAAFAKDKILTARATDGNEGTFNSDFEVDWMKFRHTDGGEWGGRRDNGPGYYYAGCDDCCGAGNTSAF
jgi:hypothetical protein